MKMILWFIGSLRFSISMIVFCSTLGFSMSLVPFHFSLLEDLIMLTEQDAIFSVVRYLSLTCTSCVNFHSFSFFIIVLTRSDPRRGWLRPVTVAEVRIGWAFERKKQKFLVRMLQLHNSWKNFSQLCREVSKTQAIQVSESEWGCSLRNLWVCGWSLKNFYLRQSWG